MRLMKQIPVKDIISKNIVFLMRVYHKSRKEVCGDLDLKYTTFCDWVNGNTYPRLDNLEMLAFYFRLGLKEMLIDIESNPDMVSKVKRCANDYGVSSSKSRPSLEKMIISDNEDLNSDYQVELINGQYYMCKIPTLLHQSFIAEIFGQLYKYTKDNICDYKCFTGSIGLKAESKEYNAMDPDIIVCNKDIFSNNTVNRAPNWIIEISSPSTRDRDFVIKKELYEEDGVTEYWVVNPMSNNTRVYVNNSEYKGVSKDNHFDDVRIYEFDEVIESTVLKGFSIKISDLDIVG